MVEIKEIPFNQTMLKKAAGEDEIEYYNINYGGNKRNTV